MSVKWSSCSFKETCVNLGACSFKWEIQLVVGDLIHDSHDSGDGHDLSPFNLHSRGVSHPGSLPYSPRMHMPSNLQTLELSYVFPESCCVVAVGGCCQRSFG
jgi:hypothetical protein